MNGFTEITRFWGVDGTGHHIGWVTMKRGNAPALVDEWEGHGLRELCTLVARDTEFEPTRRNGETFSSSVAAQADAVIREYRADAATTDRPLSRLVDPSEIAQVAEPVATASV